MNELMNLYTRFLYRTNLLITILFPKHCSVTAVLDGHICNECFRLFLPARRYASAGTSYGPVSSGPLLHDY